MFKSLFSSRKFAAAALVASLALGHSAGAADDRYALGGQSIPVPPAAPLARPFAMAPATTVMTDEALGAALSNMGYEVEAKVNEAGARYYTVKFDRADWTFVINVSLCKNGQYIWLNSPLGQIPEGATVPQEKLTTLMQKNFDNGPAYFAYRTASRRLYYLQPITNINVTPKTLRAQMEAFCQDIVETEALWNTKKWNLAATPAISANR